MRQPSPFFARAWLVVSLLALGFMVWNHVRRIERLEHIAVLTRGESVPDVSSPTGYAGGTRERVLSDHAGSSYEWIAQTQLMLAHGDWRIRHLEMENAPFGRPSHAAAPYRWWLALVAWFDHLLAGHSPGLAVERAALYADPLLHLLTVLGLAAFAFKYSGPFAASWTATGGALLYPFAAGFPPGVPDDSALKVICTLGSLLPLLAGLRAQRTGTPAQWPATFWFSFAGVCGGLGFWVGPAGQVPLVAGISLGAVLAAWIRRNRAQDQRTPLPALPWRHWSVSGAITVLIASLIEYFPDHLGAWEIRALHPLYGLGWLGSGELLARISRWMEQGGVSWKPRDLVIKLLALSAVLAVPFVIIKTGNPGFLASDVLSLRLTKEPDSPLAANLADWLKSDGLSAPASATLLPLLLLGPALWLLVRRQTPLAERLALAVAVGAVIPPLGWACFQLSAWALLDATLLVLLIATLSGSDPAGQNPYRRWIWAGCLLAILLPGAWRLMPAGKAAAANSLSGPEALGLVERDLAHWLAKQRSPEDARPIVLAPPSLTTTLGYYGGLRGVGTLSWENQVGLAFAVRIAISTSRDETAALLRRRGVTHLVLPSWDRFFDGYIQAASVQTGEMFYQGLQRWALPPWLRPLPYQMPAVPGFEHHSVRIFELVEDQDAPTAASHLTEYFIEQGDWENARVSHQALLKYPADFGVLIARAQLWAALNDAASFPPVFESLLGRLAGGADRYLAWDRRVSLAVVLARGNRMDLARGQTQRCLAELSEARLRSLTTDSLYHLLVLDKALGLEIADPKLRSLALDLLPAALRQRL